MDCLQVIKDNKKGLVGENKTEDKTDTRLTPSITIILRMAITKYYSNTTYMYVGTYGYVPSDAGSNS